MTKLLLCISCSMMIYLIQAQVLTEQEMIQRVLASYPSIRIADLEVRQKKEMERTAFNPQQPRFVVEFPGDVGVGFEAEQEFDFPGVYFNRSKWLKSETQLATAAATLTRNEIIRDVRLSFLEAQYLQAQVAVFRSQDSLWKEIAVKSEALFEGGEINKADALYAQQQSATVSFSLQNALVEAESALALLEQYANEEVTSVKELAPLPFASIDPDEIFYFEDYLAQQKIVADKKTDVTRSERLPGLVIGYLRADEPDTEFRYRYKAGITVPIWQGQYKGEIEASKLEMEKIDQETDLQIRQAESARLRWINKLEQTNRAIEWFETTALPRMNELVDVYRRLFGAGELDYAVTFRNIADALSVNTNFIETVREHNEAVIQLEFLKGVQ